MIIVKRERKIRAPRPYDLKNHKVKYDDVGKSDEWTDSLTAEREPLCSIDSVCEVDWVSFLVE